MDLLLNIKMIQNIVLDIAKLHLTSNLRISASPALWTDDPQNLININDKLHLCANDENFAFSTGNEIFHPNDVSRSKEYENIDL